MQAKGAKLVAVTSVTGCRLAALCDMCVHLPLERELCPFDLAPVTSTAAQMIFGDTVAIALMQVAFPHWTPVNLRSSSTCLAVSFSRPTGGGHLGVEIVICLAISLLYADHPAV